MQDSGHDNLDIMYHVTVLSSSYALLPNGLLCAGFTGALPFSLGQLDGCTGAGALHA